MNLVKKTPMVPNNQMGEVEYRKLKGTLSYSGLKQYIQNRYRFYKENILGEVPQREETASTILGSLIHVLLADQVNEFDSKFVISSVKAPSGQMLDLITELYKRTLKSLEQVDGEYRQKDEFSVIFNDAFTAVKYEYDGVTEKAFKGKKMEWALEKFQSEGGQLYYDELLQSTGKQVVSMQQIEQAEKLVAMVKSHPYTTDIVNQVSTDNVEVFNELIVLYQIDGIEYRSMIDRCHIDHISKTIQPYDYKCVWSPEVGWEYGYLQNCYYIQVSLYDTAMKEFAKQHNLKGYQVLPIIYITIDTTGNASPVLYKMSVKDVLMGQRGFTVRGKHYIGTNQIHKMIQWNLETGNWTTVKEINDNKGIVEMKLVYR